MSNAPAPAATLPRVFNAYTLLHANLPLPIWAVDEYLPVGLTFMGGLAKIGKSWMALKLALCVGSGAPFLGKHVQKGRVLYLALEDSPRRLLDRMQKMNWPDDPCINVDFIVLGDFIKEFGPLHKGGAQKLKERIEMSGYRLVVIDTLSRAFMGIKDVNDNQEVTKALAPIQETSQTCNCSILILDHHGKSALGKDPNPITDILGSTVKGGVLDTAWGLYREKGKAAAKLMITGRDVEEHTLSLVLNKTSMTWELDQSTISTNPLQLSPLQQKLIDFLNDFGTSTFSEIIKKGGFDKGNAWKALTDLRGSGEVSLDMNTHEYYLS